LSTPSVSILMPNMNNALVLEDVLTKLAENTTYPDVEIVISDDGSTDDSLSILRRWRDSGRWSSFKLLEREHAGIIPTLQAGFDACEGEMIARIDGDTTVETRGWLEQMLAFHALDERVGITVGKVVFDSGHVHTYGIDIIVPEGMMERGTTLREPIGQRTVLGDLNRPKPRPGDLGDCAAEVDSILGCWNLFSKELVHDLGGWDEGYNPVWYEDIDFGFAARARAQRKCFYLPEIHIVHHTGRRDPRLETDRRKLLLFRANRAIGRYVPQRLKSRVASAAKVGERDPKKLAMLERHRAHWRAKWGFDPINPDLDEIKRRYAGTEVLWRYDEERRAAGERIVAAHEHAALSSPPG
jgi:GT2 family glycosyltransferase